ncbi:MAG: hypothetical protein JSU87_05985 [Gemmatimonadota bacterium]|nr:MAG: hypothetical protein JSU87_05985 [Gemmatimonadota bacterium]
MIELQTLGQLNLRGPDGRELSPILAQPKRLALLVYIAAAQPQRSHRRDLVVALFWPDLDHEHARAALRQATAFLRRHLGERVVLSRSEEELAISEDTFHCDVCHFDRACDAGEWAEALELYAGDFLEGFFVSDASPELDQWIEGERDRLRRRAIEAAWCLAESCRAEGDEAAAGRWAQRALALAPDDEGEFRRLVQLLHSLGNRSEALQAYEQFAQRLARRFGIEPSAPTQELIEALRSGEAPAAAAEAGLAAGERPAREATPAPAKRSQPPPSPGLATSRGRFGRTVVVLTLGVAAIAAAASILLARRGPALSEDRVVVAIFENRTGDASLDPLGLMAADWVTDGLARTGLLDVVPSPDALISSQALPTGGGAGAEDNRVHALAEATGAGTVVWGAVYREGDSIRLQAQIIDVARHRLLAALEPVTGSVEAPSGAIEVLRQRVMGALGSLFDPRLSEVAMESAQPPTFEAYIEFEEGLRLYMNWQMRDAIPHLYRATALDTTYLQPILWAAMAHYILNDFSHVDSLARIANRQRERMLPSERALLEVVQAAAKGDISGGVAAVRRRVELSSAPFWHLLHAMTSVDANRPQESLDALAKFDLDWANIRGWWLYWHWPSQAHHMLGDYRRELKAARRARRQYPDLQPALAFEVQALAALGRVAELNERLDEGLMLTPQWLFTYSYTLRTAAAELRAHGHPEAAADVLQRAVDWRRAQPLGEDMDPFTRYEFAQTLYLAGRWDEARSLFEDMTVDLPYSVRYKGAIPCRINYLGYLGALAARRGDREEALRISSELDSLEVHPVTSLPRPVWRASIAALLGEKERAVALLLEAFSNGLYYGTWLHADPDFQSLHDYPPFQDLLRPKG